MKYLGCFAVILSLCAHAAHAQESSTSQALDEQLKRMQPAATDTASDPQAATPPAAAPTPPAVPVVTAPAPVVLAPVTAPAPAVTAPAVVAPAPAVPAPAPAEMMKPEAKPEAAPEKPVAVKEKPKMKPKPKAKAVAPAEGAPEEWPASPDMATRAVAPKSIMGSEGGGAIPALPLEMMTNGTISYITGGIGDEELAQLKSQDNNFNVHLMLSATTGEYISDVMVRVLDGTGAEVLSVPNAGPYFYVQLPPGSYTLEGTATQGGIKTVKVVAPSSGFSKAHITYIE